MLAAGAPGDARRSGNGTEAGLRRDELHSTPFQALGTGTRNAADFFDTTEWRIIAGCALSASPAGPIPGSRPGLTDDAVVVAPASLQAELGAEIGRLGREDFLGGELLLRYGVARAIEALAAFLVPASPSAARPAHGAATLSPASPAAA